MTEKQHAFRTLIFRAVIILAFLGLSWRLWQLQIVRGEHYRQAADYNRSRLVELAASRGIIYDAQGNILARNRPSFQVTIIPADLPRDDDEAQASLTRLVEMLAAQEAAISGSEYSEQSIEIASVEKMWTQVVAAQTGSAYRPIVVATQLDSETAFILEERSFELPGIHVDIVPVREYSTGSLTAHILGYIGIIPAESEETYRSRGYDVSRDRIGLNGLEWMYEQTLRGQKGRKHIIVDFNGREVLTVGKTTNPTPGHNLVLTLDLELQETMTTALQKGLKIGKSESGVAIALDPRSGAILGMVSLPAYDNNLFSERISQSQYSDLISDPTLPLFHRAIGGQFPPGSTFKIIPAAAALQEGVITRNTLIYDPGIIWLPNQFFPDDPDQAQPFVCWTWKLGYGHENVNVVSALAVSCDVFFYEVGGGYQEFRGLGEEQLAEYARQFGLGDPTGIDLPGEAEGLVPTVKWKRLTYGEAWVTGDTYNMSIGQGFVLATPLQILNATAAVANGGFLYRPHLQDHVTDDVGNIIETYEPELIRELSIAPAYINMVREGLYGAVNWDYGTAPEARLPDIAVAGKTGTAEFPGPRDYLGNLPTHAWFTAFAPYEDPEIALVVFVEGGGEGSTTAVPVAKEILRAYFDMQERRLYGEPVLEEAAK